MRVWFYLSTWLLTDGRYGVVHALCTWSSLQKAQKSLLIDCCRSGNLSCLGGQGDTFHPLGELVDHHQDVLIAPCCTGQGSKKIKVHPLHRSPCMVLEHLGSCMTLRELVPAAGTTCGDIVLGVPQHPIPAQAVLKPGLGPVYPLVSGCRNVTAQPEDFLPELPGNHQKPLLSLFP